MSRRRWTQSEIAVVREIYPHTRTSEIARQLGSTVAQIYSLTTRLGLRKTAEYLASPDACRLRRGDHVGARTCYRKGHVPANKGLRRPGWGPGRMKDTQFRKGERRGVASRVYKPIGTERMSKDGYLERKVNDDLPLQARWRAVHLIEWEKVNGPLPKGFAVYFVNGDRSDRRPENLTLDDLRDKEKPMEIERAKAIAGVAQVIVDSAKAENDFIKLTGSKGSGSGFIPKQLSAPGAASVEPAAHTRILPAANGHSRLDLTRCPDPNCGGTLTPRTNGNGGLKDVCDRCHKTVAPALT